MYTYIKRIIELKYNASVYLRTIYNHKVGQTNILDGSFTPYLLIINLIYIYIY